MSPGSPEEQPHFLTYSVYRRRVCPRPFITRPARQKAKNLEEEKRLISGVKKTRAHGAMFETLVPPGSGWIMAICFRFPPGGIPETNIARSGTSFALDGPCRGLQTTYYTM